MVSRVPVSWMCLEKKVCVPGKSYISDMYFPDAVCVRRDNDNDLCSALNLDNTDKVLSTKVP